MSETYVSTADAVAITGLSVSALHRRVREEVLPAPKRNPLDRRRSMWDRAALENMVRSGA